MAGALVRPRTSCRAVCSVRSRQPAPVTHQVSAEVQKRSFVAGVAVETPPKSRRKIGGATAEKEAFMATLRRFLRVPQATFLLFSGHWAVALALSAGGAARPLPKPHA